MPEFEAVLAAADAARSRARHASVGHRARWLNTIADGLEANADYLVTIARHETRLTETRLRKELMLTTFQARLFAKRLIERTLLDVRTDTEDPHWPMGPRPDLRRGHVPLGPVLVFASSGFPFALSVTGGDTVSAIAVGCPVVVKAHEGHPDLSRATARIIAERLAGIGAPRGLLGLIEGRQAGVDATRDRRIRAVAFTGSQEAGRLLFDLAMSRPDPIPFYGEFGSTNPVLVTEAGWRERADDIVSGFVGALASNSGQLCTRAGVVLVPDLAAVVARLELPSVGPMLSLRTTDGFIAAAEDIGGRSGVDVVAVGAATGGAPGARVLTATVADVLADPAIVTTELFGPASVLVGYDDPSEALRVLALFEGTLTATVQGGTQIDAHAAAAFDLMAERAGRLVWNQWPTEVFVTDAQQHGGPWPATTVPSATSVGTAAAARFVRPVVLQNVPDDALPAGLLL